MKIKQNIYLKIQNREKVAETTLTVRIHQLDTQTQKEVTSKTRPQEKAT